MNCIKCSFDLGKRSRGGSCKKCGFEFAVRNGIYMTPGMGILWDGLSRSIYEDCSSAKSQATVQKLRSLFVSPVTFMAPVEVMIHAHPEKVNAIEQNVAKQIGDALLVCDLHSFFHSVAYMSAQLGLSRIDLQRRSKQRELLGYRESKVISHVEILAAGSSCDSCKAFSGQRFTLDDAILIAPLPCVECTTREGGESSVPFCRCCYQPVIDYEGPEF